MSGRERVLTLKGGRNFRDLGGYAAADGRRVRWGRLYRSGALSGLTEEDFAVLAPLGIAVICDFRSTVERESEPTRWVGAPAPAIRARDYAMGSTQMRQPIAEDGPPAERMARAMLGFYTDLPYGHVDSYRFMFEELLAGRVPMVFNCSAGKDRTGVGAALLLTALGVSRDDVLTDYALSEKVFDFEALAVSFGASQTATGFASVANVPTEIRTPMLRSDPAYLAAAFEAIEARDGSVLGYLEAQLGVGPQDVEGLKELLLEAEA